MELSALSPNQSLIIPLLPLKEMKEEKNKEKKLMNYQSIR
jgi:hypothetical protein